MVTRIIVIVLAFAAAAFKLWQARWVDAVGLAALGAGLLILLPGVRRPALRAVAYVCFTVTVVVLALMVWHEAAR